MKFEDEIKQQAFGSDAQKALLNIIFTANMIQTKMAELFKPFGITPQQYNVLRILRGRHPKSANPKEIKEVMLDKNPDLTRLCDRMSMNGWITRHLDEGNRRKMNIAISAKGLKLLKTLDPVIEEYNSRFDHLNAEEARQLSELLDKFRG